MSSRDFRTSILAVGTALGLAFSAAGAAAEDLTILSLGGNYQENQSKYWFKPYAEASGVTVKEAAGYNFANLKVMIQSGNVEADVIDLSADSVNALAKDKLLEPIDWKSVPQSCLAGIPQDMRHPYAFPTIQWAMVMAYNTKTYPNGPKSWADFWDVKAFPGKRGSIGATRPPVEQAAMAENPDIAKLYPFDIDKAFDKIAALGSDIVFSDGYAKVVQFLADGEVDMIVIPNGRMVPMVAEGKPVAINWNQHLRYPNFFVIPKGAPHAEAAKKFLNWVCEPERLAALAKPTNYGPINVDAYKFIDKDVAPLLPGNPATAAEGRVADAEWLGAHRQDIARGWARLGVR
ncbi:ABC transporter substrate-binding protein [Ancylobacter defluvii]|uniref:ABC transporter substrate-binding protein n=1 Tax=Ancylobacter defluvii TaxID=1282440 RepID=A0A9W6K247_9HYPH|nr:ABC transporter substrate-binding protein [Ancylobacter defluvii]MBS7588420.1 ABC transporter substrate-binding protein [Ancylobacter defluvii]GLK86826.1 ABC transporter substrate-binding protein [Ancylobacter defluvii]